MLGGVQELAKAYGENTMVLFDIRFLERVDNYQTKSFLTLKPDTITLLHLFFRLSALAHIHEDIGTWLETGYFNQEHAQIVREQYRKCLSDMKRFAGAVADVLPPKDEYLDSMIAPADGDMYGSIVNRHYNLPGTLSRQQNWTELVPPHTPKLCPHLDLRPFGTAHRRGTGGLARADGRHIGKERYGAR